MDMPKIILKHIGSPGKKMTAEIEEGLPIVLPSPLTTSSFNLL